ncbi:hypothetical protein BFX40_02360 [Mesorhizobium sp. SEMIA 3007]|uniref:hypothetical protein n=1 Tax=Mesorhizobium sp. SEMIA 3007 TaxID=1862350 RepID=UPI00083D7FA5|nr:hypothetical protein [Mesorhizobium sp. SEMIA 3007]ODA97300.1 hypothetical protein BFX40_02360 [Mesorhizobium sp. SEMIA 3007]
MIAPPTTPDILFDPWATSSGPKLSAIAAEVTQAVLYATSKEAGSRVRIPKAEVVERTGMVVSSIIANLKFLHVDHRWGQYLALPMKHTALTRYDRTGFGIMPKVVEGMERAGLIMQHPPVAHVRRTGIEATGWLKTDLMAAQVRVGDIGRAEGEEVIRLSARSGRDQYGNRLPSVLVNYEDTEETVRLRAEMDEINAFLATQRIEIDGQPQAAYKLTRRFLLRSPSDRTAFNLHGRLYGAFWISMPKAQRGGLTINGEPIADLDYASMFPRLAYARVGTEPPTGDLYAIPGLEEHRAGVKAGLSALLSTETEMTRLPPKVKDALPTGWTASRFREAVATKHPALVPLFGRDIAMDLMFTESCILVAVLLRLSRMGIVALPMHDGIMVAASYSIYAIQVMQQVARQTLGLKLPVVIK